MALDALDSPNGYFAEMSPRPPAERGHVAGPMIDHGISVLLALLV